MMKTNLVIGASGFMGVPLCRYLSDKGETVIPFDIARSTREDARTAKLPLKGVHTVYFLAWDVGGSKYLYKKDLQKNQLAWNLDLMRNVFRQLEEAKTHFLFVSSQLSEETNTVYGVTKRLGEVWTDLLGGVSVRVWNAYGIPEKENIKSHVISDFIHQAIRTKKIAMLTNGEEWRQFTHISDVLEAFYYAMHTPGLRRSVYDASSYEWVQIRDVANFIARQTGARIFPGPKIGRNPLPAPNAGRVPGWQPKKELWDGIKEMIDAAQKSSKKEM